MRWGPLTGSRSFALYWSARTVSIAGNQIARVALTVLVYQLGAGPEGVSVLLLALTVPRLLGPLAGAIADRMDNKQLMVACDVAQAGLFAAASFVRWWPGVIATVLAATAFSTLYLPAGRGNIPVLAGRDNLDFESWMRMDMQYIDNWSLALDWKIILRTIPRVLTGHGAN